MQKPPAIYIYYDVLIAIVTFIPSLIHVYLRNSARVR